MLSRLDLAAVAALALTAACVDSDAVARAFTLDAVRPADARGILLNEELVLTFSQEVDPTSISTESLSIVAQDGVAAEGRWTVFEQQVRFQPAPVVARDLSDGGYRPGTTYTVEVSGFPRLDGIRASSSAPLERSSRWQFTTVAVGEDQVGFVFDDASPGEGRLVTIDLAARQTLEPGEPIVLRCAEPLDPSTLIDEEFWIEDLSSNEARRIALRGRFTANHPEGSKGLLGTCAKIELMPVETLRADAAYYLRAVRSPSLTDFYGNPVWPATFGRTPVELRVGRSRRGSQDRLRLSFLDRQGFLSLDVPGADGLAHWTDSGRLEVRYPAAAGDGRDGRIELSGVLDTPDLHSVRASVAEGTEAAFAPGRGLRVLRAQGRVSIAGRLTREVGAADERVGPAPGERPFAPGESLSDWLERAGTEGWDWTVLIAGGDMTIEGELEVDTPLLLVAGGWIRVDGRVRQTPGELWLMRDGGGPSLDPTASVPPLRLDPPLENLLKEPLRFSVITSPLPARDREYRWLGAEVGGREGVGSFEVSFLPPDFPPDLKRAVGHPRLLDHDGQLRVLIELVVRPGTTWDPPSLDYVDLTWELAQ